MTIYSPERYSSTGRADCSLRVTIFHGGKDYSAQILDLSRGGARLSSDAPLQRGLQILLRMHLADSAGRLLSVSAETRWRRQLAHAEEYEIGVRFVFEDESQRRRITDLIDRYRRDQAALSDGRSDDGALDDERRRDPRVPID